METDLSVDAAMKLVFSGGFVIPDNMALARTPRREADVDADFIGTFRGESNLRVAETPETESSTGERSDVPAVGGLMPIKSEEGKST